MKIEAITDKYWQFLSDESRIKGMADSICFPMNFDDACDAINYARENSFRITTQGACTGLTGGAVPQGGLILNCKNLKGIELKDESVLYAEAGVTLEQINAILRKRAWLFPPNPTEESATLGGLFGCNAMGIDGEKTAPWVNKLWWLTSEGAIWEIYRGEHIFDNKGCVLPNGKKLVCNVFKDSDVLDRLVPKPKMDLIDFLAGSEGHLGIALAFEFRLIKKLKSKWGVFYFFKTERDAMNFVFKVKHFENGNGVTVMEYYDKSSLALISSERKNNIFLQKLPDFPKEISTAVYVELASDDSNFLEQALFEHLEIFESMGGNDDQTWAASESHEIERFRKIRHVLPELANGKIDSMISVVDGLTRMSSDLNGPSEKAEEYLKMYRDDIEQSGVHAIIYGAAYKNRFHVNFMPETNEERDKCETLISKWAKYVANGGGKIVTENGVGLLKRDIVMKFASDEVKNQMNLVKQMFDSEGVFK